MHPHTRENMKASIRIVIAFAVAIGLLVGTAGVAVAGGNEKPNDGDKNHDKHKNGDSSNKKVTICHVPPGNPGNAHTITVSKNALDAHLAHGDYKGPCKEDCPYKSR